MTFTRACPSPRFEELIQLYRKMHQEGEVFLKMPAEKTFPGSSLLPQAARIKRMIDLAGATTILDYGCGKGKQYDLRNIALAGERFESIVEYWSVDYVHCYDPCYVPLSILPQGKFDGVICTDVLEHCPEEDLPWIIDELFSFATRFVFANVASHPAQKRLPNGENAHCTIQPPEWWKNLVEQIAGRYPELTWEFYISSREGQGETARYVECRIGSDVP
jgi:hypothetical protein